MATLLAEQQQDGILPAASAQSRRIRGGVQPERQAAGQRRRYGTVRLWNPATGQPAGTALPADTGTGARVNGVAFSPGGLLLAGARRHPSGVECGHRRAGTLLALLGARL